MMRMRYQNHITRSKVDSCKCLERRENLLAAFLGAIIVSSIVCALEVYFLFRTEYAYGVRFGLLSIVVTLAWFLAGIAYMVKTKAHRDYSLVDITLLSSMLLVLGVCFLNWVWNGGYLSLDPLSKIVDGSEHIDILFQSAIAGSYESHMVPSLLVNDVALFRYHTLSNLTIGCISSILNAPSFMTYNFAYPIMALPTYVFCIVATCCRAKAFFKTGNVFSVLDGIIVCVFFIGWLPDGLLKALGCGRASRVEGMSYAMSIALAMAYLFVVMRLKDSSSGAKRACLLLLNPIAIVLCCYAKISVGALLTAGIVLYILRFHGRELSFWAIQVLNVGAFALAYLLFHESTGSQGSSWFVPFYYVDSFVVGGVRSFFVFIALVYLLPIIVIWWKLRNATKGEGFRAFLFSTSYVYEQILVVLCVLSALPGMFLSSMGSSAYYFFDVPAFMALVMCVGYNIPNDFWIKVKQVPADRYLTVVTTFCLIFAVTLNTHPHGLLKSYQTALSTGHNSATSTLYKNIEEINEITAGHKKDFAILVDKSAELLDIYGGQAKGIFVYPAMTSLLCLNEVYYENGEYFDRSGLSIAEDNSPYYGFDVLDKEPLQELDEVLADLPEGIECVIVMKGDSYEIVDKDDLAV